MFLIAEGLFYVLFLGMDAGGLPAAETDYLKFIAVLGCLCHCLLHRISKTDERRDWTALGLTAALGGDLFLLFTDLYLPGLLCFCLVQACYSLRLNRPFSAWLLISGTLTLGLLSTIGPELLWLITAGLLYALGSGINISFSLCALRRRPQREMVFLALGLVLLAGCDLTVLLRFMQVLTDDFSGLVMWLLYLPSQLFFTLSCVPAGVPEFPQPVPAKLDDPYNNINGPQGRI